MHAFLEGIHRHRPTLIQAFPENLFEIARMALRESIRPDSPRSIVTGAGNLYPSMRPTIEQVFGAPIFDRYGSREVSGVAAECELHTGLHVCLPIQHVEILRSDGSQATAGELGEVVVTSLVNYAMPLIRYRLGDLAAWAGEECTCGRTGPLLSEVAGRTRDLFVRKDGSYVRILEMVFHEQPWIRKFQVVQEEYDFVRAFIVPYADVSDPLTEHAKGIQQIENSIKDVMGSECKVEIPLVDHIEDSPSGKFRHHISKVRPPDW
jgi:phenylacetate-CoA ligase